MQLGNVSAGAHGTLDIVLRFCSLSKHVFLLCSALFDVTGPLPLQAHSINSHQLKPLGLRSKDRRRL